MVITYHGLECFKISQGDITLALNPISKDSKHKPTNFGADITLITTNTPDTNGRDQTSRGDKQTFVIDGPGEYEMKDIFIKGFLSEGPRSTSSGQAKGKTNTIYMITFEGINLCFLGMISNKDLSSETLEAIENVDVLFAPLGEGGTLDAGSSYKLAISLEPSIIIPMYYQDSSLKEFLKEGGNDKSETIEKLVIKKKDLEGKKGEIIHIKEE